MRSVVDLGTVRKVAGRGSAKNCSALSVKGEDKKKANAEKHFEESSSPIHHNNMRSV